MLIEQLNTNNEGELGAPASGDDEEGCDVGDCCSRSTALSSLPAVPPCPLLLWFSLFLRWTSWESNGYADSLFFLFFFTEWFSLLSFSVYYFFLWVFFFASVLAPVLPLFLLCFWVNFFRPCSVFFFWLISASLILGFLLPFIEKLALPAVLPLQDCYWNPRMR